MSMTDNYSHKEEKADHSAIKKQSGMENDMEKRDPGNSSLDQLETGISKLSIKTKMSMTDNYSHKEEKADHSAIKKQSGMENDVEKRDPGNSSLNQIETGISKLSIKTKMSMTDNYSHKEEKADHSAIKKQSGMENEVEKRDPGNSSLDQIETGISKLSIKDRKEIEVKFLINVPMEVTSEMSNSSESHCKKFLDLLNRTAFRKEDEFRYKDIAVLFGLNGKNSEAVENEWQKNVESDITFKKMWFTWINKEVPYQEIREKIKKHSHNNELVSQFRRDSEVKMYYCFFDADTVDFNEVLSSYIDVIIEHIYPTVMSTGFLFPEHSKFRKESERDRQVRITTAEHFPLGTYYPEPNFCVLLPDGCDTIPERFTNTEFKQMNMESPVLIRQVKRREGFSAVFSNKNPIITLDSKQKHCHTEPWTWAISAYTHKELNVTETYKQRKFGDEYEKDKRKANGVQKSLLMDLLESDEMAQRIEQEKPFEGRGAGQVFKAAKAVRQNLKKAEHEELIEPEA